MPSQRMPGTPKPSAFFDRSVTAEWRSSAVPMPNWLLTISSTIGSSQSASMFIVSPKVPWFVAPSPVIDRMMSSVSM